MTTPERLRRRQLVESGLLIAIGLLMIFQQLYIQNQDDQRRREDAAQRACLQEKFSELSVALNARGKITERETAQNQALWGIYAEAAGIIKESGQPIEHGLTKEQQAELNAKLVDQLLEYQRVMARLQEQRTKNPLPPYPVGVCEK